MKQLRVVVTVVSLLTVLSMFAAIARAADRADPPKAEAPTAEQQADLEADVTQSSTSAADDAALVTLDQQFLEQRERYRELRRSGARADEVEAQRKTMEQARDEVRTLRQRTCETSSCIDRGAGNGPGLGQGRYAMGRGRGMQDGTGPGRHGMGRGRGMQDGTGPGRHGMGRGRGMQDGTGPGRHGMGRGHSAGGRGMGASRGRGHDMGNGRGGGMGGGQGQGRCWRGFDQQTSG